MKKKLGDFWKNFAVKFLTFFVVFVGCSAKMIGIIKKKLHRKKD